MEKEAIYYKAFLIKENYHFLSKEEAIRHSIHDFLNNKKIQETNEKYLFIEYNSMLNHFTNRKLDYFLEEANLIILNTNSEKDYSAKEKLAVFYATFDSSRKNLIKLNYLIAEKIRKKPLSIIGARKNHKRARRTKKKTEPPRF